MGSIHLQIIYAYISSPMIENTCSGKVVYQFTSKDILELRNLGYIRRQLIHTLCTIRYSLTAS